MSSEAIMVSYTLLDQFLLPVPNGPAQWQASPLLPIVLATKARWLKSVRDPKPPIGKQKAGRHSTMLSKVTSRNLVPTTVLTLF